MSRPQAYDPQYGYMYQILVRTPYARAYELCHRQRRPKTPIDKLPPSLRHRLHIQNRTPTPKVLEIGEV
ncbi:hypothetical protein JENST_174 [Brevibacillus phage Jenst]|uniref:Uncharacterized protein n=1 Tax=Brevibacillus phage Jenst TaxID=1691954 RepID=A0A0K2CNM2_9CAUD|nr:hypothetical protein AVV11_gp017 [Brevibacillus phage Jenst]ALA07303.1 hypothetical protein JENST_174 [Brevibacillus phage Jenst]